MKRHFLILTTAIFTSFLSLSAQSGTIKGKVVDGTSPLPGATITLSNFAQGTATDFDGNFTITGLSETDYELTISYVGYKTYKKIISVKNNETVNLGNMPLSVSSSKLGEVVISSHSRYLSEAKAINLQKNALTIKNVIAANGIGKLPDRNAAEAVQRIPGVSIERDQGEGRYVAVRGLPSEWNSTTMNGNRIPTGADEGGSRSTAFDFFPTEMIGYIEVSKAFTPDIDADGIGGSVNFITKTAPQKFTLDATLGFGYNQKSDKGIYSGSITLGDRSDSGKFGYMINVSQWNRNWAADNFEARRSGDYGVYRLELRDYTGIRKTTGINGAVEFNPNDQTKLFAKLNYGKLLDKEIHYKHRVRFDKYESASQTGRVELQNIYNDLIFDFFGADIGGKHTSSKGVFDWSVSTYRTEFSYGDIPDADNNSYLAIRFDQNDIPFNANYIEDRGNGPRAYWDSDGGKLKYPSDMFNVYSDSDFQTSPDKQTFSSLELYKVHVLERDNIVAAANYKLNINENLTLKLGTKFRDKDRQADFSDNFYTWKDPANNPTLADYSQYLEEQPGRTDYIKELNTNIGNSYGAVLSTHGMIAFYNANFKTNLKYNEDASSFIEKGNASGRNFSVDETHTTGYAMATYKINNKLTLMGGLRATNTNTKVGGYLFEVTDDNPTGVLKSVTQTKNYLAILPMAHLKYTASDQTNIRFAATRTFVRPEFEHLAPGGSYLAADNEFSGGNPDVNPTYAINLDLMWEHYFGNLDVVSGGIFYKSITDPIFLDNRQGTINGISGVEISQPFNGGSAWLIGAELSGNKKLDFLPGALKGLGVQANVTMARSKFSIPGRAEKTRLPRQANLLANAQLYYEKNGFNVRLAYNFKGEYITEHGSSGLDRDDIYYGNYSALDANISFKINKHLTCFAEANNLLNEPLEYYYGDISRPRQIEFHGIRGQAGVKWRF